jgi:hypothetical protein
MKGAFVVSGLAAWAPGYATIGAIAKRAHDPSVEDAAAEILSARARRGTSRVTRMLVHCATACARDAGVDPKTVPMVYGSALGETATMVSLLQQIYRDPGPVSPMLFKNSVHNAASGLASIALGNRAFSTAVAASERTTEASILEALTWIADEGGSIVVALADDRLPEPLGARFPVDPLAVAICLRRADEPGRALATLHVERPAVVPALVPPPGFARSPVAPGLALALAVHARTAATVPLATQTPRPFVAHVGAGGA